MTNTIVYEQIPQLVSGIPGFETVYKEHVADYNEVLLHVLFGDLVRFLTSSFGLQDGDLRLRTTMDVMENLAAHGDERVKELVVVSFLENLDVDDPAFEAIRDMFGPALNADYRTWLSLWEQKALEQQNGIFSTVEQLLCSRKLLPCDWILTLDDADEPPFWTRWSQVEFLTVRGLSRSLEVLIVASIALLENMDGLVPSNEGIQHDIIVNVTVHIPVQEQLLPLFAICVCPNPNNIIPMKTWCKKPYTALGQRIEALVRQHDTKHWQLDGSVVHSGAVYTSAKPAVKFLVECLGHLAKDARRRVVELFLQIAQGYSATELGESGYPCSIVNDCRQALSPALTMLNDIASTTDDADEQSDAIGVMYWIATSNSKPVEYVIEQLRLAILRLPPAQHTTEANRIREMIESFRKAQPSNEM
jgi:hypothetical protein